MDDSCDLWCENIAHGVISEFKCRFEISIFGPPAGVAAPPPAAEAGHAAPPAAPAGRHLTAVPAPSVGVALPRARLHYRVHGFPPPVWAGGGADKTRSLCIFFAFFYWHFFFDGLCCVPPPSMCQSPRAENFRDAAGWGQRPPHFQ